MAYDLKATIRLIDKLSQPARKVQRSVEQLQKASEAAAKANDRFRDTQGRLRDGMGRYVSEANRAAVATRAFASSYRGLSGNISGLVSGFTGLAAAIGGAYAAKKLWDASVVQAAKYELSDIQIHAMFRDDGKAAAYMESLRKMAVDSPLLNSNQMLANSKSFLGQTQDLETLNKAWKVAEKLMAWSPEQSVESVVFSMRELASGDALSLVERFELPRQVLNDIKKLPFKQQLVALDKLLAKLRITDDYIEKIGAAALSQWNQIKEKMDVALTEIGLGALKELKPVLVDINKWLDGPGFKNFKNSTAVAVANGFRAIIGAGRELANYINRTYVNNPVFQKLDIKGKISFVVEDVWKRFMAWMDSTGSQQIANMTSFILRDIGKYIIDHTDDIAAAGGELGVKLVKSMGSAAMNELPGLISAIGDQLSGARDNAARWVDEHLEGKPPKTESSNYHGLDYVPRDMNVRVHKGERIMPASENAEYSKGGNSGGGITITGNTFHVRQESDIHAIAKALANEIKIAGGIGIV